MQKQPDSGFLNIVSALPSGQSCGVRRSAYATVRVESDNEMDMKRAA